MPDELSAVESARRRMWADRPSPALPLVLLAAVVIGGIVITLIKADPGGMYFADPVRLAYWAIASLVAFALMILIARHQGYRTGIWVDRGALVKAGVVALAIVVVAVLGGVGFLPGDLTLRGNLPLLALTVGILVWAYRERRPGLWVLAILLVPLTLLANLYNMENVLFRLGMPLFDNADQVVNLGVVAVALLVAAGVFALSHRRAARLVKSRR
ncbi:MAG: hypothetical protein ACR2P2_21955 [Nakamurella sp.]